MDLTQNNKIASVTISLDKDILFSNSNYRDFSMKVFASSNPKYNYRWTLKTTYNKNLDTTKLAITQ